MRTLRIVRPIRAILIVFVAVLSFTAATSNVSVSAAVSEVGTGTLVAAETATQKADREASEEADRRAANPNDKLRQNACAGAEIDLVGGSCAEADSTKPTRALNGLISNIINIMSIAVGIVAVILIIIGGLKFVSSGGDSAKVSSAKNTIVYAVIGLVIVALAQFIVRFVIGKATSIEG